MKNFSGTRLVHALPPFVCLLFAFQPARHPARAQQPVPPASIPASACEPDAQVAGTPPATPRTPSELRRDAWELLSNAAADTKHGDTRIQALAALGLMGNNPRSLRLIEEAMTDADLDVRTAAALAAGQTQAAAIEPAMRKLLDDKEPQVSFSAALALWKMGDPSGGDILMAVVDGERRASANLIGSAEHDMDKTLHSPAQLAKLGVTEGAGLLLGPFGFGMTAYEYIKKNGGGSARVNAIEALAHRKSEALRKEFLEALGDKDPGVRAAAAKALASYHQPRVSSRIAGLFCDSKQPVRLTAAAAYLIAANASPASPEPGTTAAIRDRREKR